MTTTTSHLRRLGTAGPTVFPLALGCMGMSGMYGPSSDAESLATREEALDRGVTLFDTGDLYRVGHNELLLGRALGGRRDQAIVSVKFGAMRSPDGGWVGVDARPAAVKNFLAHSITRLDVLATEKGVTSSQLAIAWVLSRGPTIVPVIGARTRTQLGESLGALDLTLSGDDLARIESTVPAAAVAGTRYDAHQMRMLDSERA
ncbi:MAG: aldo/keto reductase [Acidobacteriota bacterium]|nr:aldo/keto reductase [Acidobacteriota bacterium]